ncbi:MAG: dephospho-CoA kinase [Geminicoccaceae bacterium]
MIVLGLTGSMAMGKSTTTKLFACFGVPAFDADATVHRLYGPGGAAVAPIEAAFPGTIDAAGAVDRKALSAHVVGHPHALARLESIVHGLVRLEEKAFLGRCAAAGVPLVLLDVPLLFETGGNRRCDAVAVVSAPRQIQEMRIMARPGMTREKMRAMLARQMPDAEKRKRADFVIPSGAGLAPATAAIRQIINTLGRRRAGIWPYGWHRHSHSKKAA